MKEKHEIVKAESNVPATLEERFAAAAGAGFEEMGKEDYSLPFIVLLQALSPQLDPTNGAYVEDAKPGMFLNTVTGQIYKDLRVVPCAYAFRVIERASDGKFIARHTRAEAPAVASKTEKGERLSAVGTTLVDTAYYYVLVLDGEYPQQAVISMRSTQLGKSKKWNAQMSALKIRGITPPMFSSVYKVAVGKETNEHGSWFGYAITREDYVKDVDVLNMAEQFAVVAQDKKIAEPESSDDRAGDVI